jgi:hypothetical protein
MHFVPAGRFAWSINISTYNVEVMDDNDGWQFAVRDSG